MANSSISHQGLSDAVSLFNKLLATKSDSNADPAAGATPFNELLAARQISLLEPSVPGFQVLQANALAALVAKGGAGVADGLPTALESGEELPFDELAKLDELVQAEFSSQGVAPGFAIANALAQIRFGKGELDGATKGALDSPPLIAKFNHSQAADLDPTAMQDVSDNLDLFGAKAFNGLDKSATALSQIQTDKGNQHFGNALAALIDARLNDEKALATGADSVDMDVDANAVSDLKLATSLAASTQSKAIPQLYIAENALTDPAWEAAMTARIGWMSQNGVNSAILRLNPQELGGIHIRLDLDGDKANIQFQTEHRDTSEVLERLMPRLHAALEAQGIRVDESRVSHNNSQFNHAGSQFAQQQQSGHAADGSQAKDGTAAKAGDGLADVTEGELIATETVVLKPGLDYYA